MDAKKKLVSSLRNKFFVITILLVWLVVLLLQNFVNDQIAINAALGFIIGLCDNFIMFLGVESGVKQSSIDNSLSIMKKNMFKRILFVAIVFLLAIKMQMTMLIVLLAFLCVHMFFLMFLILNAWFELRNTQP